LLVIAGDHCSRAGLDAAIIIIITIIIVSNHRLQLVGMTVSGNCCSISEK